MKSCKFSALILLLALAVSLLCAAPVSALDDPEVNAPHVVLADPDSGEVFFCRDETARISPASLTKVMTVLLAAEAVERGEVSLSDEVMASPNITYDLVDDGSTAGITSGEVLTLESLLQCALVASANEACNIIAEHVAGDIPAFIDRMNARAGELGCSDTHFANTHGLPNEDHYSTAWDLFLISREAVSHDIIVRTCSLTEITVPATEVSGPRTFKNTNALLGDNDWYKGYFYEGANGVKTGHTQAAGYCLIATAHREDISLLSVVTGAEATTREDGTLEVGSFADTVKLFDWVFNNYSRRDVLRSTEIVADLPVAMGATDMVSVRPKSSVTVLLPDDYDLSAFDREIEYTHELNGETLTAPISAGDVLGEITVSRGGRVYGRTALVATKSVQLSRMEYIRSEIAAFFRSKVVRIVIAVLLFLVLIYVVLVVRYWILRQRHLRSKRAARRERDSRAAESAARTAAAAAEKPLSAPPVQPAQPAPEPPAAETPDETFSAEEIVAEQESGSRDYYSELFRN